MSLLKDTGISEISHTKKYTSPFDRYYQVHGSKGNLEYNGSLLQILGELEEAVTDPLNEAFLSDLVWHPSRVIRATIEYKIKYSDSPHGVPLIRNAVNMGLNVLRNPAEAESQIQEFRDDVIDRTGDTLLGTKINQKHDKTTLDATNHNFSQATAERLAARLEGQDVFLLLIGYGGITAGMDVYLRLLSLTNSKNSNLYPVRYSADKMNDVEPKVNEDELSMINDETAKRKFVIFDEDSHSGRTLMNSQKFFENKLAKGFWGFKTVPRIHLATNLDVSNLEIEETSWGDSSVLDAIAQLGQM